MGEENLECRRIRSSAGEARQHPRCEKDRRGDDAAYQASDGSPRERPERLYAGSFELTVEWIGLDEEAQPEFVEGSVRDAEDKAVKNMADERTEDGGGVVGGPIKSAAGEPREQREMAEEPPKNCVTKAPPHAGAVPANVALEEEAETDANRDGDGEVQKYKCRVRERQPAVTGEQWKVVSRSHPRAENRAANDSSEAASDNSAADAESWLLLFGMEASPDSEGDADGSAETKDVSDKMREAIARVSEHCGCRAVKDQTNCAVGKNDPGEERETKAPNESCPSARRATREESTECNAEERTVEERLRNGCVKRGYSQRATRSADCQADCGQSVKRSDW